MYINNMSEKISKKISIICLITTRCVLQTESKESSAPSTPKMCGKGFKKHACDCVSLPVFILCNIYETNGKREKQEAISVPNISTGLAFLRGPSFNTHTHTHTHTHTNTHTHTHTLHCHECSSLHTSVRSAWSIPNSKHWFTTSFLRRCRKAMLGVWVNPSQLRAF